MTDCCIFVMIPLRVGLTVRPGSTLGGEVPAIFYFGGNMKELSIFVDESGDFGAFEEHCPVYLVAMVFHDQRKDINEQVNRLRERLSYAGHDPDRPFHAMPIIRREEEYRYLDLDERRKLMSILLSFIRKADISYHTFRVEKRPGITSIDMTLSLSRQFTDFFVSKNDFFRQFERVVIYYDNGQIELTKILISVCSAIFPHFEFRKIQPSNYRLFQTADFFCAFELVRMKYRTNCLNNSEAVFFKSLHNFEKNYIKALQGKEI